jgi:hypothetical protein
MTEERGLTEQQVRELLQPMQRERVHVDHEGLSRLKHHDVRRRLTQIFGPVGWSEENRSIECIAQYKEPAGRNRPEIHVVVYRAVVRLHIRDGRGGSLAFWDGVGVFDGSQSSVKRGSVESVPQTHHTVANGACSVAFLRAAISLGDQFGLSLYTDAPGEPYVGHTLTHPGVVPVIVPTPRSSDDTATVPKGNEEQDAEQDDKPDSDEYTHEPEEEHTEDYDEDYTDPTDPTEPDEEGEYADKLDPEHP